MSDLYELNRDKSRYSDVKEKLKQVIRILSKAELYDNLSDASRSIRNNFLLNGSSKDSKLINIRDTLKGQKEILTDIYDNVARKINNINFQIEEVESREKE